MQYRHRCTTEPLRFSWGACNFGIKGLTFDENDTDVTTTYKMLQMQWLLWYYQDSSRLRSFLIEDQL